MTAKMMATFLLLVFLLPSSFAGGYYDYNLGQYVEGPPPAAPPRATGQFSNVRTSVELGSGSNFGSHIGIGSHFNGFGSAHFGAPFPPHFPSPPPPPPPPPPHFGTQMGHRTFGFNPPRFGTQMDHNNFGFPHPPAVLKQLDEVDEEEQSMAPFLHHFPQLQQEPTEIKEHFAKIAASEGLATAQEQIHVYLEVLKKLPELQQEPPKIKEHFAKVAASRGRDQALKEIHAYLDTEALKKFPELQQESPEIKEHFAKIAASEGRATALEQIRAYLKTEDLKKNNKVPEGTVAVVQHVPRNAATTKGKEPEAPAPNAANKSPIPLRHGGIVKKSTATATVAKSLPRPSSVPALLGGNAQGWSTHLSTPVLDDYRYHISDANGHLTGRVTSVTQPAGSRYTQYIWESGEKPREPLK